MMDVAEFIAKNYYSDDSVPRVDAVRSMLAHPDVHFAGSADSGLVLVYLILSDEGLELLKRVKRVEDFKNGFSDRLVRYSGKDHIYVFRFVSEGGHSLNDLRKMRDWLIKKHKAKSFSWHDNQRVLLHTYEVA